MITHLCEKCLHGEVVKDGDGFTCRNCGSKYDPGGELEGHNCEDNAVPYESDGALGHGFECGICGNFLQAG